MLPQMILNPKTHLAWSHQAIEFILGPIPLDTEAMAGLAFTCLERFVFNPDLRPRITMAIDKVREKILKAQTPEGNFGNIYSTPLALQVGKRPWGHDHSASQWRVCW